MRYDERWESIFFESLYMHLSSGKIFQADATKSILNPFEKLSRIFKSINQSLQQKSCALSKYFQTSFAIIYLSRLSIILDAL